MIAINGDESTFAARHRYLGLKKALKETTMNAQVQKLKKYSPEEAIKMIQQSIENGWTGLFDLKGNSSQQKQGESQIEVDMRKNEKAKAIALELWSKKE